MTDGNETALVPTDQGVQLGSMQLATPHDVIVRATAIAKELAKIIEDKKLSKKLGGDKPHVLADGWSTLGAMLGVTPRQIPELSQYFEDGQHWVCEEWVELVRVNDGQIIGRAKGICSTDEKNWSSKPRYARASMAATRATGKAFRLAFSWIVVLAGYSSTPAEEMDGIIEGEFREPKPAKVLWTDAQTSAVMAHIKAADKGSAAAFLAKSGLANDVAPDRIESFVKAYLAAQADGLSKEDSLAKAQKG